MKVIVNRHSLFLALAPPSFIGVVKVFFLSSFLLCMLLLLLLLRASCGCKSFFLLLVEDISKRLPPPSAITAHNFTETARGNFTYVIRKRAVMTAGR
jgi:hypothetical protein